MVRQRKSTVNSLCIEEQDNRNAPPVTPLRARYSLDMQATRRLTSNKTVVALLVCIVLLSWLLFSPRGQGPYRSLKPVREQPQLHLLLPASSSNNNFCRMLLSTKILNYPVPILINWGTEETDDPYDMHILKIQKVLDYLESFPPEQEEDLVLVVDAYDVWFQLPPEVLIRRYYEQIKLDDARLMAKYGKKVARENGYRNRIYFSNDKACWPDAEGGRLACWAVPTSPITKYSYGPAEDDTWEDVQNKASTYQARPRWLNSGSIIGPVNEVRRMYETVATLLREHHTTNSDQFYFAEIWGLQEYARLVNEPNATIPEQYHKPNLNEEVGGSHDHEYHITLDYENALFQPVGFFDPYLSFVQFDGTINSGRPKNAPIPYSDVQQLAIDIKASRPPLEAMEVPKGQGHKTMKMRQWQDLPLLTNLISKHTTPIIHFMIEKEYRVKWWDRMWFAPFSKDLFEASMSRPDLPILTKPINGKLWRNAEKPVIETNVDNGGKRDGAWSDKGSWLSWNTLCLAHEEYIFTADRRDSYKPG